MGMLFGRFLSKSTQQIMIYSTGFIVLVIGLGMAMKTTDILSMLVCLVGGSIIGDICSIEQKLETLGVILHKKVKSNNALFVEGFITASLTFCVGSMAIIGAIEEGINDNPSIFYIKAVLDGVCAFIFAATFGLGVVFSAFCVLFYQGALSLLSGAIEGALSQDMIEGLSSTGGVLILALGFNILNVTKVPVGNMLPSLVLIIGYIYIKNAFFM